ncbi:hypothetical protein [Lacrimispora sp.]|uniref:hypothetical protein n=1 Tax=Lacrimispora sp. TaxID=2719234 RepID=UPI0028A6BF76|nr:hypothetical protein [Lacrimispora sp.]
MNKLNEARMDWLSGVYESSKVGDEICQLLVQKAGKVIGILYSTANVGDTVWLAFLAEAYKKHYGYKHLLFAARERQADILELFPGVDGTVPLEDSVLIEDLINGLSQEVIR